MPRQGRRAEGLTLQMKVAFITLFVVSVAIMVAGLIVLPEFLSASFFTDAPDASISKLLFIPVCAALIGMCALLMFLTKLALNASRPLGWIMYIFSLVVMILANSFLAYSVVTAVA